MILFGLLVQACGATNTHCAESVQLGDPGQFQVTRYQFSTNGSLEVSERTPPFFYGQPLNNVVSLTNENGGSKTASTGPPIRPALRYDVSHWTQENGLPATRIRAILQSRDGYLWVGTGSGLARFDGVQFTVFNQANTSQMATNGQVVRALYEDEAGTLWIGTEKGMTSRANGRFKGFPGQGDFRGNSINCLARRGAGGFWIGADSGLGYWDGIRVRWMAVPEVTRALSVVETANGIVWVGTLGGAAAIDPASGRVKRMLTRRELVSGREAPPNVLGLHLDHRDRLWIGAGKGIWRLDSIDGMPISAGEWAYASNARFAQGFHNAVWATVERDGTQLCVYRLTDDDAGNIVPTVAARMIGQTSCLAQGRDGEMWVGGWNGLFRLRPPPFTSMSFDDFGLNAEMRAVTTGTDGALWFANMYLFGRWSGTEIAILDAQHMQWILSGKSRPPEFPLLHPGSFDFAWLPHSFGGLMKISKLETGPGSLPPKLDAQFPEIGVVRAMAASRTGILWAGTSNRLYHLSGPSTIRHVAEVHGIRVLLEDRHTNLWIGTDGGGLFQRNASGEFQHLGDGPGKHEAIIALHPSDDGAIWFGTTNGLRRFANGQVATFGPASGIPQESIYGILEDQDGRLWMNYNLGIIRAQRRELEQWLLDPSQPPAIAAFGTADGIHSLISMPSAQSCVRTADGRLWFVKRAGLTVVDPAECPDAAPPQVFIERIAASAREGATEDEGIPVTDSAERGKNVVIDLAPGSGRRVNIHFTATGLRSPERVRIRYRLEGHDPDWRDASSARFASYTNLRPGPYTFRVKAQNHEGRRSEADTVLAFRIIPFFWQTWIFSVLCGAGIIGGLAGIVAWRLRLQQRRLGGERVRALERERERIARNMHDNLGAHLTELAFTVGRDGEVGEKVRESLQELRDAVWTVDPRRDSAEELTRFIADHTHRCCSVATLRVELNLPPVASACSVPGPVRHEISAMFKEALRNILQHAGAQKVTVELRFTDRELHLALQDDGCGFETTQPACAPGNGIRNFHDRCASLGGSCHIESAPGRGTRVEFIIPLNSKFRPPGRRLRWPLNPRVTSLAANGKERRD